MILPDIAELRDLLRHLTPAERDALRDDIFGGEQDLSRLSLHELDRFQYLGEKLTAAWPYCAGMFGNLTLTELFTTLDDDEMSDYMNLCRWTRGDERPAEHPPIPEDNFKARQALERAYRPDQPLRDTQRILKEYQL